MAPTVFVYTLKHDTTVGTVGKRSEVNEATLKQLY